MSQTCDPGSQRTSDNVFLRPGHPGPQQVHQQTETAAPPSWAGAGRARSGEAEGSGAGAGGRHGSPKRGLQEWVHPQFQSFQMVFSQCFTIVSLLQFNSYFQSVSLLRNSVKRWAFLFFNHYLIFSPNSLLWKFFIKYRGKRSIFPEGEKVRCWS